MSDPKVFNLTVDKKIGVVTFDVVGDAVNTWTNVAFADLNEVLDGVEKNQSLEGVIFISGKPNTFLVGANLKMVEELTNEEEIRTTIRPFHSSFNRIGALQIPTLAAVNGHCLGGGLEFALACTARIAGESKTTVIGLPEVNVGLIPGAGGTQRLPRLIGYPAVDLIVKGAVLPAKKAYEMGIVDRLAPAGGDLLENAKTLLRGIIAGTIDLKRPEHDFSRVDDIMAKAEQGCSQGDEGPEGSGAHDGCQIPARRVEASPG